VADKYSVACLPVGRHGRRAGADRRSIAAGELGRYAKRKSNARGYKNTD